MYRKRKNPRKTERRIDEMKRLIDANSVLRSIDVNGSAYDGSEYQAYKAGVEYVRSLIEDAPAIKPESMRHDEEWISVKDRLPDVFDEVLVYDTFSIAILQFQSRGEKLRQEKTVLLTGTGTLKCLIRKI